MNETISRWCRSGGSGLQRILLLLCCLAPAAHAQTAVQAQDAVIEVAERKVSLPEFETAVRQAMRQKFYHGKVPEPQVIELQREVANQIVDRVLLLQEAQRRDIKPHAATIADAVAGFERRYGASSNWQQNRDKMLANVVPELEQRNMLEQLEKSVRDVAVPAPAEVQAFYEARPELFTEPEKLRLSVIQLTVDPSSTKLVWDKALEEAKAIHKRLLAGADFAELAKIHSGDASSAKGGDMGYLHRGMLSPELHDKLDGFKPGVVQEPIVTLHGVAIFRLDERVAPRLHSFDKVQGRASDLLRRERSDGAWKGLIARLRQDAKFSIREERFSEIAARLK